MTTPPAETKAKPRHLTPANWARERGGEPHVKALVFLTDAERDQIVPALQAAKEWTTLTVRARRLEDEAKECKARAELAMKVAETIQPITEKLNRIVMSADAAQTTEPAT